MARRRSKGGLLLALILTPFPAFAQCVLTPHPRVVLSPCFNSAQCVEGSAAHNGYVPAETSVVSRPNPILRKVEKDSGETPGTSPENLRLEINGFVFGVN